MKRLDRYIWRELMVPFLIGSLGVLLMFQANYLIFQFKTYSVTSVPWTATVQMILYQTPDWLIMTLPMATSLAASLAISRLTRESELTAIRCAGVSILRVLLPVIIFGLAIAGLNYYVAEKVKPVAKRASKRLAADIYMKAASPEFRSNVTLNLKNKIAIIGTVARGENDTINLHDILLYEKPAQEETILTTAETGTYQDGVWTLTSPRTWQIEKDSLKQFIPRKPDGKLIIMEPVTVESLFSPPESDELTTEELVKAIEQNRKQGMDTKRGEIALQVRYSVPASCIIFALVSPIFAIYFARTGAFLGVLLSIFVVMGYYNVYIITTEIMGPNGLVSPWLAAWLPNLIFAGLGVLGLRRLE